MPEECARRIAQYATVLRSLYSAVAEVSGCDVLVDSSKRLHGYPTLRCEGIDTRVVHMVRESRAVAHS